MLTFKQIMVDLSRLSRKTPEQLHRTIGHLEFLYLKQVIAFLRLDGINKIYFSRMKFVLNRGT